MRFTVPIRIPHGKKMYSLNLNGYRNWHYVVSAKLKANFKEAVKSSIQAAKTDCGITPASITYTLYLGTKRRSDVGNWCSVIQKFTEDCLVDQGVLVDDDYSNVRECRYVFGGIDPKDPRCEVEIKTYKN